MYKFIQKLERPPPANLSQGADGVVVHVMTVGLSRPVYLGISEISNAL